MTLPKLTRIRKSFVVAALLASCLHSPPSSVEPTQQLELGRSGSGPRGKAPFGIVTTGPRGVVETGDETPITVVFNRPMRSLEVADDVGVPELRLLTAEGQSVAGKARFMGTRGLLFLPDRRLPGGNRFTLTVPAGTKALDGSTLSQEYSTSFETSTVKLLSSFPSNRPLRPNESFFLRFSQPLAPLELAANLRLEQQLPGQKATRALPVTVKSGAPAWSRTGTIPQEYQEATAVADPTQTWFEIVPTAPLPLDSLFELVIAPGLRSTEGSLKTQRPIVVSAKSFGPLYATNLKCAKQSLGRCQAHRDLTVVFSNPVHPDELRRYLAIDGPPRRAKPNTAAPLRHKWSTLEHPLGLDPDYGDRFRITLRKGMTDIFGQKLDQGVSFEMQIEEPYVKPTGSVAQATGADDSTELSENTEIDPNVPRRPKLKYELELGLTGHIIEANAKPHSQFTGQPPVSISSINVPSYGIATTQLSEHALIQWVNDRTAPSPFRPFTWITPGAGKNLRSVHSLDLDAVLDHQSTGSAVLSLLGVGELESQDRLVNVTDLAITAKMSKACSLIWVTRLSTAAPVAAATLSVIGSSGNTVAQGTTDPQGQVFFSSTELHPIDEQGTVDGGLLLIARTNDDYTYQRLDPLSETVIPGGVDYAQKGQWTGLVFTDRSVYRPGERVQAGGFFRRTAEPGFTVSPHEPYRFEVKDSSAEVIAVGEGKLDRYGALALDIPIARGARLGRANLTVKLDRREAFAVPFELREYQPAEFKVTVTANAASVVHRETSSFSVSAEYLFGGKISEGRLTHHVSREEVEYVPPESNGYVVEDRAYQRDLRFSANRGSTYLQDQKTLDPNGQLTIPVSLDAPEQSRPELLTFEAEVQDLSQKTQSARTTVLVHPGQFYLGLKPPASRFLATGAELPREVVALKPQGERVSDLPVTLELWQRSWTAAVEDRPAGVLYQKHQVRDELRGRCSLLTGTVPSNCHLRLAEPGYYVLRATAEDPLKNRVHSSYSVYVTSERADTGAPSVEWKPPNGRQLPLELDRNRYRPGEEAKVLIKSPFQKATALVTVERAGILSHQVVEVSGKLPIVSVPVTHDYFPNAFISVQLLRGRIAPRPLLGQADVGAPDYRIGYAELVVDPESHRLALDISTSKRAYLPGEEVEAELFLHREDGHPLGGSVTFYVVDEGVLRLTGYKTPDPLPAFTTLRTLGVFALESRKELARFLHYRDRERVTTLGFETPEFSGDKGFEGGGGGELPGRLRSDFRSTAYFAAGRPVDASGKTRFRFKLPDSLTSYRLMAVATADEDRFGFGESSLTVNRPLMARPILPRMLRVGDRLEAQVVVTAKTPSSDAVDITLKSQGVTALGPQSQHVRLDASGQARVPFPVAIEREGEVSFEFAVRSAKDTDRVRLNRHAEQPITWLRATRYGTLDKPEALGLGELRSYRKDQGTLSVTVSNSALVGLGAVFDSLATYPYGCTEQLTSRLLPLLYAPKLAEAQTRAVALPSRDATEALLAELVERIRYDGSVAYFPGDQESQPWLAAYTKLALEAASRSQYYVPRRARDQLSNYLLETLDNALAAELDSVPEVASPEVPDAFGTQVLSPEERRRRMLGHTAFVANVLARVGELDESRLRRLLGLKSHMAHSSRIQLLGAMALLRFPRQETQSELDAITKELRNGPEEASVTQSDPALSELLDSPTRSTAQLLIAILALDPAHPMAPKLARALVRMRSGSSYRNTQEEAWVLMALEEYRKTEIIPVGGSGVEVYLGEQLQGSLALAPQQPRSEHLTISAATLLTHPGENLTLVPKGAGVTHYAVELALARASTSEKPIDEGLSVDRLYRAVDLVKLKEAAQSLPLRSESRAVAGQLIIVDLLLETAEPRDRIVLDDPLPAGLESIDFAFATTTQALSSAESVPAEVAGRRQPQNSGYGFLLAPGDVHREMKDGKVTYFISHLEPGIYHLRYLARATSPGRFTAPPARASAMYEPEIFGQTGSTFFEIAAH